MYVAEVTQLAILHLSSPSGIITGTLSSSLTVQARSIQEVRRHDTHPCWPHFLLWF